MLGEYLQQLAIEQRGVVGDRAYALWDVAAGKVASAKNPKVWADLLRFQARYLAEPVGGEALPLVAVQGPFPRAEDGMEPTICSDDCSSLAQALVVGSCGFFCQSMALELPDLGSLTAAWYQFV